MDDNDFSFDSNIIQWAKKYKIEGLLDKFKEAGFDTFDVICQIDSDDLDWMKIIKPGERKKIMIAISNINEDKEDNSDNNDNNEIDLHNNEYSSPIQLENEILEIERLKDIDNGRNSVIKLTNMLNTLSPMLTQGHRINEDNPLYIAICQNNTKEISRLIQKIKEKKINIDINELCGETKTTVLHTAISNGDIDIIKELLSIDNINHKRRDGRGRSILLSAIALENIPVLRVLLDYDKMKYDESQGLNNQTKYSIPLLLEYENSRTFLYLACCSNNESIVLTLLKYFPKEQINKENKDSEGQTPLFAAITRGDKQLCAKLIKDYGANPNYSDNSGTTPLVCAVVDHDDYDLVEILLKYGANPTQTDDNGMTALDIAAALDKSQLVKLLLSFEKEHIKKANS